MALVLYEYPFNEGIRTMLRLEHLSERLVVLAKRAAAVDHHFALATLFEIMDVASRADLKSDVLKELERHRAHFNGYRGHPGVDLARLDAVVGEIDQAYQGLNQVAGKAGHALTANEWLMSVRSRISIPGGTCEFDLPAYYAWQQLEPARRQADLQGWMQHVAPLAQGVRVLIGLLRDSGTPQRMMATGGSYQQNLQNMSSGGPSSKMFQLLRVRVDGSEGLVPEITAHRLIVAVRMMRADSEGRLRPSGVDVPFELTLCA
jgi:cell division protein ZapD